MSKTALFKAAAAWELTTLQRVLAAQPALAHSADARGRLAIHVCARRNWLQHRAGSEQGMACLRALIEAGTPFDAVHPIPDDGEIFQATPLWYAVAHGRNPVMARWLLDLGTSPDNCLFAAVWNDDAVILQMLLEAGAPTEVRAEGATPLLYAARLGRQATLRVLLDAGADPAVHDRKGRSAVQLARLKGVAPALLARLGA